MAKNRRAKKRNHKPTKPPRPLNPPPTLIPDLFLETLYRTRVKSLIKLRCVSKSWVALIDDPTFIKLHLKFNTSRNKELICNSSYDNRRRKLIAFLRVNGPPIPVLHIDKDFTDRPNYPRKINFRDFSKNMVLAGSFNGIVCLSHRKEMLGRFVALWNPAINHWNPIALPQTKSWQNMSVGLGFDAVTNDFKIICIVPLTGFEDYGLSRVEIYSANRDSWDNVDEGGIIPFLPNIIRNCKFIVKGVPYWVGIDTKRTMEILGRIDPCTGLFKKFLYPGHVKDILVHPVNLNDSVAALIHPPGEYLNQMIDLYVLDENTASWTKMYSIGPFVFEGLRTPQCLSTGEIVLATWTGDINHAPNVVPYFCDPKTNRVLRNNEIEALKPSWYESYSHVESLVCLKGMVQIGKEHNNKKTDPKTNWTEYLSKEMESVLHL